MRNRCWLCRDWLPLSICRGNWNGHMIERYVCINTKECISVFVIWMHYYGTGVPYIFHVTMARHTRQNTLSLTLHVQFSPKLWVSSCKFKVFCLVWRAIYYQFSGLDTLYPVFIFCLRRIRVVILWSVCCISLIWIFLEFLLFCGIRHVAVFQLKICLIVSVNLNNRELFPLYF